MSQTVRWMAPWIEKTDGEEIMGDWEVTLPTRMMLKLLGLWLTEESRERVESVMEMYHPTDRAAMAYALVVWMMTGRKMELRSAVAAQHFKTLCEAMKKDMPELSFAAHMKYMVNKYGPKKEKNKD